MFGDEFWRALVRCDAPGEDESRALRAIPAARSPLLPPKGG